MIVMGSFPWWLGELKCPHYKQVLIVLKMLKSSFFLFESQFIVQGNPKPQAVNFLKPQTESPSAQISFLGRELSIRLIDNPKI